MTSETIQYCQSCSMPISAETETFGTNADGNLNEDYCHYCYQHGKFTAECSMEEMIEFCVPHMASNCKISEQEARETMQRYFPTLKRWQQH